MKKMYQRKKTVFLTEEDREELREDIKKELNLLIDYADGLREYQRFILFYDTKDRKISWEEIHISDNKPRSGSIPMTYIHAWDSSDKSERTTKCGINCRKKVEDYAIQIDEAIDEIERYLEDPIPSLRSFQKVRDECLSKPLQENSPAHLRKCAAEMPNQTKIPQRW